MTIDTDEPTRSRGPYAKTAAVRETILDAATDVFAESGFRSGSIRGIAARADMSEAGVLHHFPSKAALLEGVMRLRDERSLELAPIGDGSGADVVRGLLVLAAHNQAHPGIVKLYTTVSAEAVSPDHPAHAYFVERYEFVRTSIGTAFRELAAEGCLREGIDPESAAIATVAQMDGLQVQWLLHPDQIDMAAHLRGFLEALVNINLDIADEGRQETSVQAPSH
ncbi:TetR/AcrR family transcriptional regulator [Microbacterium suaedae]|uniref:TetR/AcrR family transcriptional regulator n=1 Tax=Microbacterium suaedae TaxID=2067813 RepID=UPI000DA1A873|nr:TetR/AcrR family transcriptional regulator [Microbacterium suaedae]